MSSNIPDVLKVGILLLIIVFAGYFIVSNVNNTGVSPLAQVLQCTTMANFGDGIYVRKPNKGGEYAGGDTVAVSWRSCNVTDTATVTLGLKTTDGLLVPITTSPNDRSENMVIPTAIAGGSYYVYISTSTDIKSFEDISDLTISVVAPVSEEEEMGESDPSSILNSACDTNGTGVKYCNEIYTQSEVTKATYVVGTAQDLFNSTKIASIEADLYLPPSSDTARPAAVFAHAGGGDKADGKVWCDRFATRGWACASLNYRTVVGNFDPQTQKAALSDMQETARWLRANATKYNIDPTRIVFIGSSAGAITSVQAAISANNQSDVYFNDPVVNKSNPSYSSKACAAVTLSGASTDKVLTLLDANDPPAFMYHGEDDMTVPYSGAVKTYNSMIALGIPSNLMSFADTAHKLGHSEEIQAHLWPTLYDTVIKGTCSL